MQTSWYDEKDKTFVKIWAKQYVSHWKNSPTETPTPVLWRLKSVFEDEFHVEEKWTHEDLTPAHFIWGKKRPIETVEHVDAPPAARPKQDDAPRPKKAPKH